MSEEVTEDMECEMGRVGGDRRGGRTRERDFVAAAQAINRRPSRTGEATRKRI